VNVADADASVSTGAMIALYPPAEVAAKLAVDGGLAVDDLHCTIVYCGKATAVDRAVMLSAAAVAADRAAIEATISGHARFTGGPDGDVAVALVDSPQIEQLRRDLVDALADAGIEPATEHGFTAHITQSYLDPTDPAPVDRIAPIPVVFEAVSVVHGGDRIDIPLRAGVGGLAVAAREAYADGWARSGGPMTERVKDGCSAAIEHALIHADDPWILEATLQIGALEGLWALVFQRREQVYADHLPAIVSAWRQLVGQIDVPDLVRTYRQRTGPAEADQSGQDKDRRDAVARALLVRALQRLLTDTTDKPVKDLLRTVADAVLAGHAEGVATALGIAAHELGHATENIDFAAAYNDALVDAQNATSGRTATSPVVPPATAAAVAVGSIGQGTASDVAGLLVHLSDEDATEDDMVAAVTAAIDDQNQRSAHAYGDFAIGAAIAAGAAGLFAALGVQEYDWITAGDSRVCKLCLDREANSPYEAGTVPDAPAHPICRCITVPSRTVTSLGLFLRYVTGGSP
jgi:2'-5' RNA ligase